VKLALLGKPNTGKSTLSNRLTSSERSLVSDIAGTTRDVVEGEFSWKGQRFRVLDTAGMRKKNKVTQDIEYYSVNRAIKTLDECDIAVLLIDATEGLSEQDKKIAGLACERGRGVIFALNKWDLMPDIKNSFNAECDRIRYFFGQMNYAPVVALSAETGEGVDRLLETARKMARQLDRKLETSTVNELLEKWQRESPPPSGPHTRFTIKYGLQTSANPVEFKIFVSRPDAWTTSYHSYICNKIRADGGFSMLPVRLLVEKS
jgi:GTP-binding protein